jgi:hypothetical protein
MSNPLACPKCDYERKPTDAAPFGQCPNCGVNFVVFKKARQEDELARQRASLQFVTPQQPPPATRPILVKSYKGSEQQATAAFQADATLMAAQGYVPTAQTWVPGSYGAGSFILALLLCFVLIGFLVFLAMLIVKPPGSLSVTYSLTETRGEPIAAAVEKTCPRCAEHVKVAAKVCRFCGHDFTLGSAVV